MAAKLPSPDGRWSRRNAYAAIDLGTNNCRLLIAKPPADGFIVVDAFSRIVRLGEGLATNGGLCYAALDRAIAALSVCAETLRRQIVSASCRTECFSKRRPRGSPYHQTKTN